MTRECANDINLSEKNNTKFKVLINVHIHTCKPRVYIEKKTKRKCTKLPNRDGMRESTRIISV